MPYSNHLAYEFGPYRLSLAQRVLTRDGEIISLTPKATEILVQLVVNAGQLLEKDDLLKEVWPDTFVEEANLTQNIFTLRRALGDERAGPRYIETVSRRGYRFIADVRVCDGDGQASTATESAETQSVGENDDVVLPRPVVAVLPFLNETGDEGLEYLAEGLTDNIINNLSRVSRLRVMSRSAVLRRNVHAVDPQNIGKELGATVVLVGKITSRPAALVEPTGASGLGISGVSGMEMPGAGGLEPADSKVVTSEPASGMKPSRGANVETGSESNESSCGKAATGRGGRKSSPARMKLATGSGVDSSPENIQPATAGGLESAPENEGSAHTSGVNPAPARAQPAPPAARSPI
jgi:DNA-binding winged helix-turn-helix (wHTH) protein